MRIHAPRIRFSHWARWSDQKLLKGTDSPGVYLLAHFRKAPAGPANTLSRQVIYIGETCQNSLFGRWRQFNRSAFQGKRGHSGGKTFRKMYGATTDNLYVAAFPVGQLHRKVRPYFIRYVERKLIWDYCNRWGFPPRCNRR